VRRGKREVGGRKWREVIGGGESEVGLEGEGSGGGGRGAGGRKKERGERE